MIYPIYIPVGNTPATPGEVVAVLVVVTLIICAIFGGMRLAYLWEIRQEELALDKERAEFEAWWEMREQQKLADKESEEKRRMQIAADAETRRRNWLIDRVEEQVK